MLDKRKLSACCCCGCYSTLTAFWVTRADVVVINAHMGAFLYRLTWLMNIHSCTTCSVLGHWRLLLVVHQLWVCMSTCITVLLPLLLACCCMYVFHA